MLPAAEQEEAAKVLADFERDKSAKAFKYLRDGIFQLSWQNTGNLYRSRMVAFLRRNENLISISYNHQTGIVTVMGTPVSDSNAQRILDMGLNMQGELRVITDAQVTSQNALRTYPAKAYPGMTVFVWEINSIQDPTPTMKLTLQ